MKDKYLKLEIESLNKTICKNIDCKFNLAHSTSMHYLTCNLKRITLNEKGECTMKEEVK